MAILEQTRPTGAQAAPCRLPLQHEAGARDRHERPTGPDPPVIITRPWSRGARTSRAATVTRADRGAE